MTQIQQAQTLTAVKQPGPAPERREQSPAPISVQTRNVFETDVYFGNTRVSNNGALEVVAATGLGSLLGLSAVKAPTLGLTLGSSFLVAGTPAGVGAATALMLRQDNPVKVVAGMTSGALTGAFMNGVLQGNLKGAAVGAAIGAAAGGLGAVSAIGLGKVDDFWSRVAGAF